MCCNVSVNLIKFYAFVVSNCNIKLSVLEEVTHLGSNVFTQLNRLHYKPSEFRIEE